MKHHLPPKQRVNCSGPFRVKRGWNVKVLVLKAIPPLGRNKTHFTLYMKTRQQYRKSVQECIDREEECFIFLKKTVTLLWAKVWESLSLPVRPYRVIRTLQCLLVPAFCLAGKVGNNVGWSTVCFQRVASGRKLKKRRASLVNGGSWVWIVFLLEQSSCFVSLCRHPSIDKNALLPSAFPQVPR